MFETGLLRIIKRIKAFLIVFVENLATSQPRQVNSCVCVCVHVHMCMFVCVLVHVCVCVCTCVVGVVYCCMYSICESV